MRYVIVGGNGFVGTHLTKSLIKNGQNPVVIDQVKNNMGPASDSATTLLVDITNPTAFNDVELCSEDVVIHLAARQYHNPVPNQNRQSWFDEVNVGGLKNTLECMLKQDCSKMVFMSTDMVYGLPTQSMITEDHPLDPIGEYGRSKKKAEKICHEYREQGVDITIFRPRLISGPGRLGIFAKLFALMDRNIPVPMIGSGQNCYQMISVFDCVSAIEKAVGCNVPNLTLNLGSNEPPKVVDLLKQFIERAGSKSWLMRTPARPVKECLRLLDSLGMPLMYAEQYMVADQAIELSTQATREALDWTPQFGDTDMLWAAYNFFQNRKG